MKWMGDVWPKVCFAGSSLVTKGGLRVKICCNFRL